MFFFSLWFGKIEQINGIAWHAINCYETALMHPFSTPEGDVHV